jgi:hypothetical protein
VDPSVVVQFDAAEEGGSYASRLIDARALNAIRRFAVSECAVNQR